MPHPTAMFRRAIFAALAGALLGAAGCGGGNGDTPTPPPAPAPPPPTTSAPALEHAFPALSFANPVAMLQAPGDNTRWFVVERGSGAAATGRVIVFPNNNAATPAQATEFINLPVNASGEGGLLGMAFHPDFPATPEVYLSYTRTGPSSVQRPLTSVISRFLSRDGGATLDRASEEIILTLDQPFDNHNGGHIAFDAAGKLFIGFGDGGSANDPDGNGQNTNTLLGKMLRIDVDGVPATGKNYAIPGDNPYAIAGGAPEIYALGLRNPWRWSFDRDTGRLWLADVGQNMWEEVNIIERGGNYGWDLCEGAHRLGSTAPCASASLIDPIAEYDHSGGNCSITGGHVYRGGAIAGLAGAYLFGDFCSGTIWTLRQQAGAAPLVEPAISSGLSVVSFGQSHDGEVYVVNLGGTLHKVIAAP